METLNRRLKRIVEELVERGLTLEQGRNEFERQFIVASLGRHDGSVGRAARALGIHRNTLRNKVAALEISLDDVRASLRESTRDSPS